jgi:hypothetical protein
LPAARRVAIRRATANNPLNHGVVMQYRVTGNAGHV